MEHRIDFIRRLFVVAITVGFASRIGSMEWFAAHRWPTRPEWHAIALLAVGLAAIIESWDGYFASIAEKPQKRITRFIIDIMVAFAYLFLLLSSTYLPFFISVMAGIFLLYVLWNISLYLEYKEEFISSPAQARVLGENGGKFVLKQLA
jgi:ABC-type dipeptide/oligopeptide/nickel transport system permease subunit